MLGYLVFDQELIVNFICKRKD